jgi:hypothetical protein
MTVGSRVVALAIAALLSGCQAAPSDDRAGATAIVGLDGGAVRKLLGEPGLIRRQYRTAGCILDVVLYDQASGPRVAYAEARTPAAQPAPADNCLSDVVTAKEAATS